MSGPPQIPADVAMQIAWHRDKVRICELEFQIGELQLALADERAARKSLELTIERDQLAAVLNTSAWRFDFDRYAFVSRDGSRPPPPGVVDVEAVYDGDQLRVEPHDDVQGRVAQVRVRYDSTHGEAFEARGRQAVRDRFAQATKVIIAAVPVTGLTHG